MRERSTGVRALIACAALAWALAGCSDPYKQVVAAPGGDDYPAFSRAMEKLPAEEKRLVNEYVARKEREGVRTVGVTVRDAIDDEAKYERERDEFVAKLAHGVGRVVDVAGRVLSSALPAPPSPPPAPPWVPAPANPAATPAPPPVTAAPSPIAPPTVAPLPPAPVMPPPPATAAPPPPATAAPPPPAAPVPPSVGAMTPEQFTQFIDSVESTPFAHDRVARIKAMPPGQHVTTVQSVALAQTVPHPSLQVEALASLYPRVTDPQNFESAYDMLAFSDDRERLRNRVRALR